MRRVSASLRGATPTIFAGTLRLSASISTSTDFAFAMRLASPSGTSATTHRPFGIADFDQRVAARLHRRAGRSLDR